MNVCTQMKFGFCVFSLGVVILSPVLAVFLMFICQCRWYTSWQRFAGLLTEESLSGKPSEVTRPGPIDNHDIIESESDPSDPQLRKMLEEGVDYALVPQEVWNKLVEW